MSVAARQLAPPGASAVLFDLRGTLVDATSSWCLADALRVRFLRAHGVRGADEELGRRLEDAVAEVDALTFRRRTYFEQDRLVLERAAAISGIDLSDSEVTSFERWRNRVFERAVVPFEEALPTLVLLRALGVRVGCVADGRREWTLRLLARVGLLDSLDVVVASEETGEVKATGAALRLACRRLGIDPSHAVFVGDRMDKDFEMAQKVGARPVLLARGGAPDRPDVETISSLIEVLDLHLGKDMPRPNTATT